MGNDPTMPMETTPLGRRTLLATAAAGSLGVPARAQGRRKINIGLMNDASGPYRDTDGPASLACAQLALKQIGPTDFDVEILYADHQNKPDLGAAIVRQWLDRGEVDMVLDVPTSSVALAVNSICKERNRLYINCGAGTTDLTGEQCTPVTIHWSYDTYMLAKVMASQLTRIGGDKWYFITADYVFGQQLARDGMRIVKESGGSVKGESRYPFPQTTDFSSQLLSAQASGANVVGLANAGNDTINCIKQAREFGLTPAMNIGAMLFEITDIVGLGLEVAQGLYMASTFYWDSNDRTRRFNAAIQPAMPDGAAPNMIQAGCYAATLHYLKVIKSMGADKAKDGAAVCQQMKATPTDDDAFGPATIRADGLVLLPAMLYRVKTPAASKSKWDVTELVATIPPSEAWKALAETGCPLVKG